MAENKFKIGDKVKRLGEAPVGEIVGISDGGNHCIRFTHGTDLITMAYYPAELMEYAAQGVPYVVPASAGPKSAPTTDAKKAA